MTREEAQAIVNAYRCRTGKATEPEYMAYMRARGVLSDLGVERMTSAQRGFLAAAAKLMMGPA